MTTTPRSRIIPAADIGWQEIRPGISLSVL